MIRSTWQRDGTPPETIEENWLFRLSRERFRSTGSNKVHDYYVVHLADAVNIIALTPSNRVVLVRQFRAGSGLESLETPGGLVEPGEDPLVAAARELREETGYEGDPPKLLGTVWSNPSILSSRSLTVLITNVRRVGEPELDAGEEVHVELIPAGRIPWMIRDGVIDHALAVQGLLLWLASQLPESPLATPGGGSRVRFPIWGLMLAVALSAGVFAALRGLGQAGSFALFWAIAVPFGPLVALCYLDPPSRAVLLRASRLSLRRALLRFFAVLGMIALLLLAGWFFQLALR